MMMRCRYVWILGCLLSIEFGYAQSPCINNPSFETGGSSCSDCVPTDWVKCNQSPDGSSSSAYAGTYFYSIANIGGGVAEKMGQQLCASLVAGNPYSMSLALKRSMTAFPFGHVGGVKVYGGTSSCTETELLWTSATVSTSTWGIYTGSFTPASNYDYIVIAADCPGNDCSVFNGTYVGVDDIQMFSTLPVEWLNFSADFMPPHATNVKWTTATEINNHYFALEISADGKNFTEISHIQGAGNSSSPKHYQYLDEQPRSGIYYYRLRQVDFDGKFQFSQIVAVRNKSKDILSCELRYTPDRQPYIYMNSFVQQSTTITIIDVSGRTVLTKNVQLLKGDNEISIEDRLLNKGIHFGMVSGVTGAASWKFLIE